MSVFQPHSQENEKWHDNHGPDRENADIYDPYDEDDDDHDDDLYDDNAYDDDGLLRD